MNDFFVGQKVVCIDVGGCPSLLMKGNIYTVRNMNGLWLRTKEVKPHEWNSGFHANCFRPLESKAISIFRAIAANPRIKIREDA